MSLLPLYHISSVIITYGFYNAVAHLPNYIINSRVHYVKLALVKLNGSQNKIRSHESGKGSGKNRNLDRDRRERFKKE